MGGVGRGPNSNLCKDHQNSLSYLVKLYYLVKFYYLLNKEKMAKNPNQKYFNDLTVKGRRTNVFAIDAMLLIATLT